MPGLSKVIVLDPDARTGRQVQLGFEREGVPVTVAAEPVKLDLLGDDTGLVVIGGVDGDGLERVRQVRATLDERRIDAAIVFAGRGAARDELVAAGADEIVLQPAYLRDVVTIGRLLCGVPATHRGHLVGNLIEITGVYTLVRAFAALDRSATLTLVRGLRRGEIRFWHGEVTSAQVGMIHGQAALHQLLLWTDARFDFHHEDVVRRQQIPLTHDELFADAERFLEGVRDSSGGLSPSIVLDQDLPRVQSFGRQIPTEVYGVLRMFDGHRVLADVLEDSAYRVFETLRVTQRAVEIGLLRVIDKPPVRPSWRAVLSIEEWLVGSEGRDAVVDSGPIAAGSSTKSKSRSKKRRKKKRVDTPVAVGGAAKDIDWGALVPRIVGAEVGPLAGVVPAAQASGEIAPRPDGPRDRAVHAGGEPKVMFDEAAERARNAAEIAARADAVRAEQARVEAAAAAVTAGEGRVAMTVTADDTKPERVGNRSPDDARPERIVGNRTTLPGVAVTAAEAAAPAVDVSGTVTMPTQVPEAAVDVSGAVTRPTQVPDAAVAEVSGAVTTRTTVPDASVTEVVTGTTTKIAVPPPPAPAPAISLTPDVIVDEPSDGVIVQHITTAQTAPVKRRRLPTDPPEEDDRPEDATGEITSSGPRATAEPRHSEPSILIADLAAIHSAVSAIAGDQAAAAPTVDAASEAHDAPVVAARHDAVAFSEVEEAFFRAGHDKEAVHATAPIAESFDDLDEGYRPQGFWARLRDRSARKARLAARALATTQPGKAAAPVVPAKASAPSTATAAPSPAGSASAPSSAGKPGAPSTAGSAPASSTTGKAAASSSAAASSASAAPSAAASATKSAGLTTTARSSGKPTHKSNKRKKR